MWRPMWDGTSFDALLDAFLKYPAAGVHLLLVFFYCWLRLSRSTAKEISLFGSQNDPEKLSMGRSRSQSYSPTRRDRSRSPFRKNRRRDNDVGARRKSWRGRELGGRYSSAPTSLLVRNIARDSRHSHLAHTLGSILMVLDVMVFEQILSGYNAFVWFRGSFVTVVAHYVRKSLRETALASSGFLVVRRKKNYVDWW